MRLRRCDTDPASSRAEWGSKSAADLRLGARHSYCNHIRAAWFVCHTWPWEMGQRILHGISQGWPRLRLLAVSSTEFVGKWRQTWEQSISLAFAIIPLKTSWLHEWRPTECKKKERRKDKIYSVINAWAGVRGSAVKGPWRSFSWRGRTGERLGEIGWRGRLSRGCWDKCSTAAPAHKPTQHNRTFTAARLQNKTLVPLLKTCCTEFTYQMANDVRIDHLVIKAYFSSKS